MGTSWMFPNNISPVPTTTVNPALGSDLSAIYDLTPNMAEVSGRTCLVQNLCRRLTTPRGGLIYDLNYGYDLTGFINAGLTPEQVAAIQPTIVAEMLKDQRVLAAKATVQWVGLDQVAAAATGTVANPNPVPVGALVVSIQITDGLGPFNLTLSVDSVTATVLQVNPNG